MRLFISRLYITKRDWKNHQKYWSLVSNSCSSPYLNKWRHQQAFIKFIFITRSPQSQRSIVFQSYPQIFVCVLKNRERGKGCQKSVRNLQCETYEPIRVLDSIYGRQGYIQVMQSSREEYAWKIPQLTWFFSEKPFGNHSPECFLRSRVETGFSLPGFVWIKGRKVLRTFASTVTCANGKLFSQFRRCNANRPIA